MSIRVGIAGVSGYGGGELLRLAAGHPQFEVVFAAGDSSAGQKLIERYPGIAARLADLKIEKFEPANLPKLDLLFASLPTGQSKSALAAVPSTTKIVDIGGDHRYAPGWVYGLADVWPEKIRGTSRVANPGCYPSASLLAIAPLIAANLADPAHIIIDAKSGVSGAGRGGGDSKFGFAEVNEDLVAYGLLNHVHVPEMVATINALAQHSSPKTEQSKTAQANPQHAKVTFTPHLIPMTRGILSTCYLRGHATTEQCLEAATRFYSGRRFVRVTASPPHTKWATGSNLAFVSYASANDGAIIALGAIDNLGKGAAGQAMQNANLMFALDETAGLEAPGLWP
jgi:N-acetyl-gamma-glutamyl-phosphate reductase